MPLQIVRNDITKMNVDAIVNAAKNSLLGGGGVDGAIHRAAGAELLEECKTLGGCETGSAKLTRGYNLPCKYVIHTVGPVYIDGNHGEEDLLRSCYRSSLELAKKAECKTLAFPLISSGIYGYPKDKALRTATDTIGEFLLDNEMTVYLVVFDKASYTIGEALFSDIKSFIDDCYVDKHRNIYEERLRKMTSAPKNPPKKISFAGILGDSAPSYEEAVPPAEDDAPPTCAPSMSLKDALKQIDESFSEMLLRKIDESGMKDSQVYKKANIDRKLFSKIRSDKYYKPSKPTAIAFAIALELPLDETKDMLMKAGFALSHSNEFDIIIEYFIAKKNYNIFEINEALFAFDQCLLGA